MTSKMRPFDAFHSLLCPMVWASALWVLAACGSSGGTYLAAGGSAGDGGASAGSGGSSVGLGGAGGNSSAGTAGDAAGGTTGSGGGTGEAGSSGTSGDGGTSATGGAAGLGGTGGTAGTAGTAGAGGVAGTGGAAGSAGSAGTAGAGGGAGSGGQAGEPTCPENPGEGCPGGGLPDEDVALVHADGWIEACDLDLVGVLFTAADEVGSDIDPRCFSGSGSSICVQGQAVRMQGEPGTYWGAVVGLLVCDPSTSSCPDGAGWAPGDFDVAGLSFGLSGALIPAQLRLTVRTTGGVEYCANIGFSNFVAFDDLVTECWTFGGTPYQGEPISIIQWNIVSSSVAAVPFAFCIDGLEATLKPCVPECTPGQCGDNGCGGTCGCEFENESCVLGQCVGTCQGFCGEFIDIAACNCDPECSLFGDCCADYCQAGGSCAANPSCTPAGSCAGLCGFSSDDWGCQCDEACFDFGDCCPGLCTTACVSDPVCQL
jgi:hypothetical protein